VLPAYKPKTVAEQNLLPQTGFQKKNPKANDIFLSNNPGPAL